MNPVKAYLFWIIAGVVFVVWLVLFFVWTPSGELGGQSMDAVAIKEALDRENRTFRDLVRRFKKGNPTGTFDPLNEANQKSLTNDYLLTPKWDQAITPKAEAYNTQLGAIRTQLQERSKGLREEITTDHSLLTWYQAYRAQTGQLVQQLRDAGCLLLPSVGGTTRATNTMGGGAMPGMGAGAVTGGGGGGGGGGEGEGATRVDDDPLHPETGTRIRELLGLYTTASDFPDAGQHPLLTTRFRVAQLVGKVLMASATSTAANPIIDVQGVSERPVALAGLEWQTDAEPLQGKTGEYATYLRLTLKLQGSESALLAALAGFESMDRPLAIVTGSTLTRLERQAAGARPASRNGTFHAAAAALTLELVIFDYADMPDPGANLIAAPQAPRSMPGMGMPGMPGGMPMGAPMGGPPGMQSGLPPGMSMPGAQPAPPRPGPSATKPGHAAPEKDE